MDDGVGKKRISVILDDDDTLTVQKIPIKSVRPLQRFDWRFDGSESLDLNQQALCAAVISIYG